MTNRLVLPFQVRPNYVAQLVVPGDMTKDEASRLCAFVLSLAQPEPANGYQRTPQQEQELEIMKSRGEI